MTLSDNDYHNVELYFTYFNGVFRIEILIKDRIFAQRRKCCPNEKKCAQNFG